MIFFWFFEEPFISCGEMNLSADICHCVSYKYAHVDVKAITTYYVFALWTYLTLRIGEYCCSFWRVIKGLFLLFVYLAPWRKELVSNEILSAMRRKWGNLISVFRKLCCVTFIFKYSSYQWEQCFIGNRNTWRHWWSVLPATSAGKWRTTAPTL